MLIRAKINPKDYFCRTIIEQKNIHSNYQKIVDNPVDNVDNYKPRRLSPTETMSPAPIVINRSPFIQFCNK